MTSDTPPIAAQGVATLPDEAWAQARHRTEIIGPLAALEVVGHEAADEAAQALGLSRRQVYVLIRRARQGTGLVTDLTPGRSGGGKGKGRLPEPVERIIRELLQKRFLTKQKRSLAAFHREVAQACKTQKLPVPARNTVAQRIAGLHPAKIARSRGGQDAARPLQGAGGIPPEVTMPLEQVQIDHTVIDLIVVDERDRQPIGRPYLTLAIDVFTRCVLGMVVTLEAPSAVSVGLCLAHAACDKRPWLEGLNVEMDWPMSGKPRLLYLDNAAEFKSEALRRGCEQHGIRLDYRPPGQPHYGGIVERIIGTAMQMIHDELPGTTFSNPGQRGEYDSEKMATLTLRELERWLALAVGTYHGSVHNGLLQPPAARWAEAVARWRPGRRHPPHRVFGRFPAGDPPHPDPHRLCHRPHPLLRRRPQAVDCPARALARLPDPARSARHQPHLGAGTGRAALPGNPLPHLVASGRHPLGTTPGAGEIASARARAGGRVGAVPHDRADARDRDHRPEGHAQGAARRGSTPAPQDVGAAGQAHTAGCGHG
jgi:putative transposase